MGRRKAERQTKKVMFVSDYLQNEYNSVSEILTQLLKMPSLASMQRIVCAHQILLGAKLIHQIKSYGKISLRTKALLCDREIDFFLKLAFLYNRIKNKIKRFLCLQTKEKDISRGIISVIKKERPDLIVFFDLFAGQNNSGLLWKSIH